MEYRELGRTGVHVSAVSLGTMTFGQQNTEAEGHAQMDYALERGINYLRRRRDLSHSAEGRDPRAHRSHHRHLACLAQSPRQSADRHQGDRARAR